MRLMGLFAYVTFVPHEAHRWKSVELGLCLKASIFPFSIPLFRKLLLSLLAKTCPSCFCHSVCSWDGNPNI